MLAWCIKAVIMALLYHSGGVSSVAFKLFFAAQCAQRSSVVLSSYLTPMKEKKSSNMSSLAMMMRLISICLFSIAVERGRSEVRLWFLIEYDIYFCVVEIPSTVERDN